MAMTEAQRRERGEEIMARTSRAPADEPHPHDSLGLIEAARRNWESDPSLRVEFRGDFARYAAFYRAEAKGLVKILAPGRRA